ncbi:MAG: hypothetical protein RL380_452, partial [Verrucomicrobiota bacterium]
MLALTALSFSVRAQTTWLVNNTTNIGGYGVGKYGAPTVVSTPYGNAVHFNGVNDGLVVSNNPLGGMSNLTVELIFKHDQLTVPLAWQPRIVHVQSPSPPDHRLTLETRVVTNSSVQGFLLDTFLRFSGTAGYSFTLTNGNFPHTIADWAHMAVTYDGTNFRNYVNAQLENSNPLNGLTFTNGGYTSIGMRGTFQNYFQGAVLALRFTPRVLATNEVLCVPRTRVTDFSLTNQVGVADFALTSGLPLGFTLQAAASP